MSIAAARGSACSPPWSTLAPEAKRRRILRAADGVFSSFGLDASMPAVAAAAEAGVGSLYRQFPSKRDLLAALVAARLERVGSAARSAYAGASGSYWSALTALLTTIVHDERANDFLGEAIVRVGDHPDVVDAMARSHAELELLLRAAIAEGELRDDATILDIRLLFISTRAARRMRPEAAERMLTLVLDGYRARR